MERPLVCTIYKVLRRRDLDDKSFRRARDDRGQHVRPDQKRRTDLAHRRNRRRRRHPDRIREIGELVCGRVPRLQDDREITILKNNGLSVQFAGVGAAVMRRARERGLGRELPSYLF